MHNNIHHPKPKLLLVAKDEIMAEISAQLQILAETRKEANGTPNSVLNTADERFAVQFDRWINKYLDKAKERMSAFVVTVTRKATTNIHRDWDEAEIHLSFPWYWNETTFANLGPAVQDYIVNYCLYEALALILTAKDPVTVSKMETAEDASATIKHCVVSSLPGTQRKKLHPF